MYLPYHITIPLLGIYPREKHPQKALQHMNLQSSSIQNSQKLETAQVPINRMNGQLLLHCIWEY